MKHYYQGIHGFFNYEGLYCRMVTNCPDPAHFVEIGCWLGRSAIFMGVEIINSEKNIRLDCIDPWDYHFGDKYWENLQKAKLFQKEVGLVPIEMDFEIYDTFLENIKLLENVIHPIRSKSCDAIRNYANNSLDFVFLDGSFEYKTVRNDIISWYTKLKVGGVLAGHGYDHQHSGVIKAVSEFFPKFETYNNSWIWIKQEEKLIFNNYLI